MEAIKVDFGRPGDRRDRRLLYLSSAISSVNFGNQGLTLPIYFRFLQMDAAQIGLLFTASMLVGAVFAIPFGVLADRIGRKRFLIIGRSLQALSYVPFLLSTDFMILLPAMMLSQVGSASSQASFSAMLADKTIVVERNAVFTYNSYMTSVGSSVGAGVAIIPYFRRVSMGYPNVDSGTPLSVITEAYWPLWLLLMVASLLSLLVLTFVHESMSPLQTEPLSIKEVKPIRLTSAGRIVKFSLTMVMISLGAGMIVQMFSLWLYLAFSAQEMELMPFYVVVNLTMGLGYYLAKILASRMGSIPSIVVSQSAAIVLLVMLPNIPVFQMVAIVYIFRSMLMNMSTPIQSSYIMSVVPPDERAKASSISNSASAVARSAGPAIGGYLMENVSMSMPFYVCGALYASSTALLYVFFRKIKPKE